MIDVYKHKKINKHEIGYNVEHLPKYCALCFQPLPSPDDHECGVCGQKTTPISVFDKLEQDKGVRPSDRTAPRHTAVMMLIAVALEIFLCVFALFLLYRQPEPVKDLKLTSTTPEIEALNAEYDLAEQYSDPQEYLLAHGSSFSQEEIKYYYGIWNGVQLNKSLEQRAAENAPPVDPTPVSDVQKKQTEATVTMIITLSIAGIIAYQLFIAVICVLVLLKNDKAVLWLYGNGTPNGYLMLATMNFLGAGATIYCSAVLISFIGRLSGGDALNLSGKIRRAQKHIMELGEWECACGYLNAKGISECRSCGRYK